ncbi:hypothetical protein C8A00DRAFT_42579 [Chaetomidium leptoderma]|uniref:GPI inositol-deacylase n=1 Tax=Chaetomidium leptoderma TaxID=669021 RepID=A0AAN6ZYB3_9PEZI|nr:hypothetical protein C8A00DRAFT_42579 [Chaetomidium leptoderma]
MSRLKIYTWSWGRRDKGGEDARGPTGLRLLHASAQPLVDLIFVHGLRGGSVKTWRKGVDPAAFWPQCWLPSEPGLEHVNIYSFGYDSDWASTEPSILDRPIIMAGHSMGGLVIKKAFLLAQNVPEIGPRIRCIFFLATPHRGSDYAATLNNILAITGILSPRQYITDLMTGSVSIQLINEDFGNCAHDLPIFSFFETLRTSFGVSSALVVDRSSAVLGPGYNNERVQYINANHRDICKYNSPDDPNYLTVKNALVSAVADLVKEVVITKWEESIKKLRKLRAFLGISDRPDEQLQRVEGSCEWIDARDDFREWRDRPFDCTTPETTAAKSKTVSVFWVHANPGTGKTILASHVVSRLQDFRLECAYHYFRSGDTTSRSLGTFLRSIAYQMAVSNAAICDKLLMLAQDGKGIFQARVYTPQYWVIDALDECSKYHELFTMLKGERPGFPLRIFLTSRMVGDMQRLQRFIEATASVVCIEIPIEASLGDIRCYVSHRIDGLPVGSSVERGELADTIIDKSNGSFLWARLVMDELENAYSTESIVKVLESIPEGMRSYYERTINTMTTTITLDKHIAKAVLMWAATSARRLTAAELSEALKLDINTVLPSIKSAVEGLCGQLVAIDRDSGLIHLIHPTVREFLLSDAAGEFAISQPPAHERIALACLHLLSSNEMRPPRNRRLLARARPPASPFLNYALTQFSEHIAAASTENDRLLAAIDQFFKTNSLGWIEKLAEEGSLHSLIRASKNLKSYLDRRAKYQSPLNSQAININNWSVDLSRLVTRYGQALVQNPSSIYFLIPPLCPSGSAIYQEFGKTSDGLVVTGQRTSTWHDCIANISFGDDGAVAVSCSESLIAVGMVSGDKQAVLRHKYPVYLVHLVDNGVVSCTSRSIVFQDLDGNTIWDHRLRIQCLYLTSSDDCILAVSQRGHLLKWDKQSGALLEEKVFKYQNYDADIQHNGPASRVPHAVSISPDMEMLALAYGGGAVCLWETAGPEFIDWARDDNGRQHEAAAVLFNPNPSINLLLVIYADHGMALFDTWSGGLVHSLVMPQPVGLLSASCSPDGRTLVTTDTQSNMRIWDFKSLSLLYHVVSHFPGFRILSFTSDGSNIIDVMDSGMRIWSPSVLVRKVAEEDAIISDDVMPLGPTEVEYESRKMTRIRSLCPHPNLSIVVAGKQNGEVVAFNTNIGKGTTLLYSHQPAAPITKLAVSNDSIASSNDSDTVQVWSLLPSFTKGDKLLLQTQAAGIVKQLCFSRNGEYLLVATRKADSVYRIRDGNCVGSWTFEAQERRMWKWLLLPQPQAETDKQHFSVLADGAVEGSGEIHLQYALDKHATATDYGTADVSSYASKHPLLAVEVRHHSGFVSSSTTFLYDLSSSPTATPETPPPSAPPSTTTLTLTPLCPALSKHCMHLVGFSQEAAKGKCSLVFIHQNSWVSSIEMPGPENKDKEKGNPYTQHFFIPNDYLSSNYDIPPVKTAADDIVFCLHGELVGVRNGMKFQESKMLE